MSSQTLKNEIVLVVPKGRVEQFDPHPYQPRHCFRIFLCKVYSSGIDATLFNEQYQVSSIYGEYFFHSQFTPSPMHTKKDPRVFKLFGNLWNNLTIWLCIQICHNFSWARRMGLQSTVWHPAGCWRRWLRCEGPANRKKSMCWFITPCWFVYREKRRIW